MNKHITATLLALLCIAAFAQQKDTFTDTRDGKTYKTTKIGEQVWMAENLNYEVDGSECYSREPAYCVKYGRLYNWAMAMALSSNCNNTSCSKQIEAKHQGVCPSGWHIPSNAEWETLFDFARGDTIAGKMLKAASGWDDYTLCYKYDEYGEDCEKYGEKESGNGTDNYGFLALPGGSGYSDGIFDGIGDRGEWWSATEYSSSIADLLYLNNNYEHVGRLSTNKSILFSVRCVKD
jgi:uncharacterized protein (TIGR02145 family)